MPPMSLLRLAATLWTRDSRILLGGCFIPVFLIAFIWRPLTVNSMAVLTSIQDRFHYSLPATLHTKINSLESNP